MATTRLCLITRSSRVLAHELRRLTRQSTRSIQSIEDYLVQLVRWAPSKLLRERLIMKKFATVLAAGALGKGGPGGLKAGPGGLKTGGLKPPPGGFKPN